MTNSSRIAKISLLIFGLLVLASASWAQKYPPAAEKIAQAYGIDSFGQIDAVRSTFKIDFPGRKVAQSWIWEPKADRVTYEGKYKDGNPVKVTYVRSQLTSQPEETNRSKFQQPSVLAVASLPCLLGQQRQGRRYWHAQTADRRGSARRVVVTYPAQGGGYTPGNTWEMYVGPDNRVQQLTWRLGPGAHSIVSVVNSKWQDYRKAGPIVVSLDHRGTGDDKPLRIFFTDVAVKLAGSDTWVNAQ